MPESEQPTLKAAVKTEKVDENHGPFFKRFNFHLPKLPYIYRVRTYWNNLPSKRQKRFMKLAGIIAALLYIGILKLFHVMIRPDHAFVAFLIIALFFGDARNFIKYWGPFILLWLSYDMLRGIAWLVMPYVYVKELYYTELALYGWVTHSQVIPFMLQNVKTRLETTTFGNILDFLGAFYYVNHMTIPIIIAWLLYWKVDDKTEFKRLVYTLIMTSYAAFITFLLFPTAPPWYVWNNGGPLKFTQPLRNTKPSAAGLVHLDRLLHLNIFSSFYETFNANPYAAFPSLHAGYSLISVFFAIRKWKKKGIIMILWPMGMWFFAMYLNHHYLIDLLWGAFYATVFFIASLKLIKPKPQESSEKQNGKSPQRADSSNNREGNSKMNQLEDNAEDITKNSKLEEPKDNKKQDPEIKEA